MSARAIRRVTSTAAALMGLAVGGVALFGGESLGHADEQIATVPAVTASATPVKVSAARAAKARHCHWSKLASPTRHVLRVCRSHHPRPKPTPTAPAPSTASPTSSAPTTTAPTSSAPTTTAPTTSAPTTTAPTSSAPTTTAPTSVKPTATATTVQPTATPTSAKPTATATSVPPTATPTSAAPTTTAPTSAAPTTTAPTTPAGYATKADWADAVLAELNAERAANGLPALKLNAQLVSSAHSHNLAMAKADTLSHQLPGEAGLGDRITAAGYRWTSAGENIAYNGNRSQAGMIAMQKAMYGETPPNDGHRRNILSTSFTEVGVDVIDDSVHGKAWLVTDFGRP